MPNPFCCLRRKCIFPANGTRQDKVGQSLLPYAELYATSNFSLERIRHMIAVREHVFTIAQNDARPATLPKTQSQRTMQQATPRQHQQLSTGNTLQTASKSEDNIFNLLLLIGGIAATIALVILAVIV